MFQEAGNPARAVRPDILEFCARVLATRAE